jgi:FkbM family methyltransferase
MSLPLKKYSLCDIIKLLNIERVLDVGCNQGHWADSICGCVSKNNIVCVDGNNAHKSTIEGKGYRFISACLSYDNRVMKFYSDVKGDVFSTGRSLYLETTSHFNENSFELMQTKKLDDIFSEETFNLIKMDIQGAEYDALKGGVTLLNRTKCLILETSTGLYEYNLGSPTQDVLIEWLGAKDFVAVCSIDDLVYNGLVAHQDLLFVKSNLIGLFDC